MLSIDNDCQFEMINLRPQSYGICDERERLVYSLATRWKRKSVEDIFYNFYQ